MRWMQTLSNAIDFLARAVALDRAITEGRMTPEEQAAAVRVFLHPPRQDEVSPRHEADPSAAPAW
jgi:hypothetical protein